MLIFWHVIHQNISETCFFFVSFALCQIDVLLFMLKWMRDGKGLFVILLINKIKKDQKKTVDTLLCSHFVQYFSLFSSSYFCCLFVLRFVSYLYFIIIHYSVLYLLVLMILLLLLPSWEYSCNHFHKLLHNIAKLKPFPHPHLWMYLVLWASVKLFAICF